MGQRKTAAASAAAAQPGHPNSWLARPHGRTFGLPVGVNAREGQQRQDRHRQHRGGGPRWWNLAAGSHHQRCPLLMRPSMHHARGTACITPAGFPLPPPAAPVRPGPSHGAPGCCDAAERFRLLSLSVVRAWPCAARLASRAGRRHTGGECAVRHQACAINCRQGAGTVAGGASPWHQPPSAFPHARPRLSPWARYVPFISNDTILIVA